MSNPFVLPKQVPLTNAGNVYPGAKAFFYRSGTSTPKNTYTDASLTTSHANPVVADGGGMFPMVFLDTSDFEYRVTLKSSTDLLIYTQDNVGGRLTQAEFNAFLSGAGASVVGAVLYPRTAAETAAGVTPTNYLYPHGFVDRYGTNTSPGTTEMGPAIRKALDCVPLTGGGIQFLKDQVYLTSAVIYIPQRIAGPASRVGILIEGNNATLVGPGNGTITLLETGTGTLSTGGATNWGLPPETAATIHYGTVIQNLRFTSCQQGLKLFNFIAGCGLYNLFFQDMKGAIWTNRSFYHCEQNIFTFLSGLGATDSIFLHEDNVNTIMFSGVHANSGSGTSGIGWQISGGTKACQYLDCSSENVATGIKFNGQILGTTISSFYFEQTATAIDLGSQLKVGLNIEGCYFEGVTTCVTGDAWSSGRWGQHAYISGNCGVTLSGTTNTCEVDVLPRQYQKQGGTGPHTGRAALPTNWTVNPACLLRYDDYIYDQATGLNAPVARLSAYSGGDGSIAKAYTGKANTTHSGQIPFCTTSVVGTTVTVDTQIPFVSDAGGLTFDVVVADNIATRYIAGRTFGGTSVFRYDALGMTVTVSNSGGFFRFVFAGFSVTASLVGGEIRII